MMESSVPTLLLAIVAIIAEHARAEITVKPSATEVIVGGSTYLRCSTSLSKDVNWYHVPAEGQSVDQRYVYYFGDLFGTYRDRFEMHKNGSFGSYNIFIPSVALTDAGVYICQDDEGNGEVVSAELTVLEDAPTCSSTMKPDGVVGINSCNMEPEKLRLSCNVLYRGKSPPLMEWRKINGNGSITQGLTIERSHNRVTYHLTLVSEPSIDGTSYFCRTLKTQDNCISSAIKIVYALSSDAVQQAKIGDTVECKANASHECTYKWKWFKGDDTLTVSNDQTLIPKQRGNFRCEAECFIKKNPCLITAMSAYVDGGNTTSAASNSNLASGYVALIVICIVLLFAATIASIVYLLYKRRRTKQQPDMASGLNGGIPMEEAERLLQIFSEGSAASDISALIGRLTYIDKGLSGEVYGPCKLQKKSCAIQRILYSPIKLTEAMVTEILEKGNNWKKLEHTNIIKFYTLRFEKPALYISMEYAEGGTVRRALDFCKEDLTSDVVSNWALQIANGMQYLHANKIVHRHLKSAQILIKEPFDAIHSSHNTLKVASYRLVTESVQSAPGSFKGMFAWASPETIQQQKLSEASDVWSYGVTVWEILTREIPYSGNKHRAIMEKVLDGNNSLTIPSSCSIVLRDILKDCWTIDPEKRPDFSSITLRLTGITDGAAIPKLLSGMSYIDKGSSGEIYGPFLFRRNKCACERILYSRAKVSSVAESDICHQANHWMQLNHKNVVTFYDVRFEAPSLYVVMNYAEGGSVRSALDSCTEDLEVGVIRDWAMQIAEGMNFLHTKDIVHNRLKSAQVLIMEPFDPSNPSHKTLKIASYRLTKGNGQSVPMSFKGMFAWMAPELIQGELNYKASDVWSYGVTVWEILTKAIPHKDLKQAALIKQISEGSLTLSVPSRCPDAIRDVLQECWNQNKEKRPTFSDILFRLNKIADS